MPERWCGLKSIENKAKNLRYNRYIVNQFFNFEDVMTYKNKIPFAIDTETDDVVTIPTKKSFRLLICGQSEAGKSFTQASILSRAFSSGNSVAIPTDVKPEYDVAINPLQKKFHKLLLPNEKPVGLPIKMYFPYFFTNLVQRHFQHRLIQVSLNMINEYDFYTLLGFKDLSDAKQIGIEAAFEKVRSKEITDFTKLKNFISTQLPDISSQSKKLLVSKIERLENYGVIGNRFEDFSFSKDINEGFIPCLNLCGFTEMGKYTNYADAYVAIIVRDLVTAKQNQVIPQSKKLIIAIDEAPRFIPNIGLSSAKNELIEGLHLGRIWGISWAYSAQSHISIDEEILQNVNYVIMSSSYDIDLAIDLVKKFAPWMYTNHVTFRSEMSERMGSMDRYEWLFMDRRKKEDANIRILSPLCCHLEE